MSMSAVWVEFDDGKLRKQPCYKGVVDSSRWFLSFDDDDLPELVVESGDVERAIFLVAEVISVFRKAGLPLAGCRPGFSGERVFGETAVGEWDFAKACRSWLTCDGVCVWPVDVSGVILECDEVLEQAGFRTM